MKKQEKTPLTRLFQLLVFIAILFPFCPLLASPLKTIRDDAFASKPGDYAVFSRGSKKIFLLVRSVSSQQVCIEIIEFASLSQKERALLQNASWKQLIHQLQSPRRIFFISLARDRLAVYCWNPSKDEWRRLEQISDHPFFVKLLQLPLSPVPQGLLRTSGRGIWSPQAVIEGSPKQKKTIPLLATWPKDASLLSERKIVMYFADPHVSIFPLWTSIETPTGPVIVKTIDTGHNALSPHSYALPE